MINEEKYVEMLENGELYDYITNLQQENEELKKNQRYYKNGVFSLEYDKETLRDMVDDLQQENERLKENNMSYQEEMARTWKIADDYKSRIEKAVEYIKEHQRKDEFLNLNEWQSRELLNILNVMNLKIKRTIM